MRTRGRSTVCRFLSCAAPHLAQEERTYRRFCERSLPAAGLESRPGSAARPSTPYSASRGDGGRGSAATFGWRFFCSGEYRSSSSFVVSKASNTWKHGRRLCCSVEELPFWGGLRGRPAALGTSSRRRRHCRSSTTRSGSFFLEP